MELKTSKYRATLKILLAWVLINQSVSAEENIPIPTPSPNIHDKRDGTENIKTEVSTQKTNLKPRIYQSACPAVLSGAIIGKVLPEISDGQCGTRSPLEVEMLAGVSLNSKVILNCRMATSLVQWIEKSKNASKAILNSELLSVMTSTSYDCRQRRSGKQGKLSEHSFANALDISGFKFKNDLAVLISQDWNSNSLEAEETPYKKAKFLLKVRNSACSLFTTVLSPEANEDHKDHFHFDLGCHGKNCTYTICE